MIGRSTGRPEWYVGVYWHSRNDSACDAAERVTRLVTSLEKVSPAFANWHHVSAGTSPFAAMPLAQQKKLLEENRILKGDRKTVDNRFGYRLELISRPDKPNTKQFSLEFLIGGEAATRNRCVFSIGDVEEVSHQYSGDEWLAILTHAIDVFEPRHGRISSLVFSREVDPDVPVPGIGWATYVSNGVLPSSTVSSPITITIEGKGTIFISSRSIGEAMNKSSIGAAKKIYKSFQTHQW